MYVDVFYPYSHICKLCFYWNPAKEQIPEKLCLICSLLNVLSYPLLMQTMSHYMPYKSVSSSSCLHSCNADKLRVTYNQHFCEKTLLFTILLGKKVNISFSNALIRLITWRITNGCRMLTSLSYLPQICFDRWEFSASSISSMKLSLARQCSWENGDPIHIHFP